MRFETIIIGARGGHDVRGPCADALVIDHAKAAGEKSVSGGGRCNFTNIYASAENFLSENTYFAKSALCVIPNGISLIWCNATTSHITKPGSVVLRYLCQGYNRNVARFDACGGGRAG